MSVEAINWAIDLDAGMSPGEKLLLVIVANSADHCGVAFPGHDLLAARCCCHQATISRNIKRLEQAQIIVRRERRRRNGSRTSDWIVLAPLAADRGTMKDASPDNYPADVAELARSTRLFALDSSPRDLSGDESSPDIGAGGHLAFSGGPDTSEEPSEKTPSSPTKIIRYNRKRVSAQSLQLAEEILTSFNDLASTTYPAYSKSGAATGPLQRIIGAVLELDGLTVDLAERMIRHAFKDPFWAPNDPTTGNVFGPGVRDRNYQAARRSTSGSSAAGSFIDRADRRRAA